MTQRPAFIIKVCGITSEEDAVHALDCGANALGFNFYPASPRFISPQRAAEIIKSVRGSSYIRVGVFVNPTEFLDLDIDVVQVHGHAFQPPSDRSLWRALAMIEPTEVSSATDADAFLLDSPTLFFGGSGRTFDWSLARRFPHRKIIAGGLDASNVAAAIDATAPWGVDSCSRLESGPGRKDPARVRAFVEAAKSAFLEQTVREEVHSV